MLDVVVVSPARPVYEGRAKGLRVPSAEGQLGIQPKHADLVAALGVGELKIEREDGKTDAFAVWGGFLKVGGTKVTVLVDRAEKAAEIDKAAVQKELEETKKALRAPKSDESYTQLMEQRAWCQSRIRVADSRL